MISLTIQTNQVKIIVFKLPWLYRTSLETLIVHRIRPLDDLIQPNKGLCQSRDDWILSLRLSDNDQWRRLDLDWYLINSCKVKSRSIYRLYRTLNQNRINQLQWSQSIKTFLKIQTSNPKHLNLCLNFLQTQHLVSKMINTWMKVIK